MASESGDPFDGGSPPAFHRNDDDSYKTLLGQPCHTDFFDLSVPDSQPLSTISLPADIHDSDAELAPHNTESPRLHAFSLGSQPAGNSDSEARSAQVDTLMQQEDGESLFTVSDHIRALLGDSTDNDGAQVAETEDSELPSTHISRPQEKEIFVKQEEPDFKMTWDQFAPAEVIDLSDDDVIIKQESDQEEFKWISMPDDTISISDDSEDDLPASDDGTLIPIGTLKRRTRSTLPNNIDNDDVIELGSDNEQRIALEPRMGTSFLSRRHPRFNRTPIAPARLQELQERYKAQALLNHRGDKNAQVATTTIRSQILRAVEQDEHAWMSSDCTPDQNAGGKFKDLQKGYKAKVKKGTNTLDDNIQFARAEKGETLRLARLKAEYDDARGYNDGDESDEDDPGEESLFVSPSPTRPGTSKRQRARDDGSDDETAGSESTKQRKPNSNRKRTQAELEKEQTTNMMAGIEGYLHKKRGKSGRKSKNTKGKKSGAKNVKRPTQPGYLNDTGSLLTSNVFHDADANADQDALPVSTETNKAKALAALVASVPLADRREAASEKEHIKRATITLGKYKVKPDGNGEWAMKGMISSLRHHQVQGAAFMKERETGGEMPLGGLLADVMGAFFFSHQREYPLNESYFGIVLVFFSFLYRVYKNYS